VTRSHEEQAPVPRHKGVVPTQGPEFEALQETQVPVATLQRGVVPEHIVLSVQPQQYPLVALQYGVGELQPRAVHDLHPTAGTQVGFGLLQNVESHWVQAPVLRHLGVEPVQGLFVTKSHLSQFPVPVQSGVVPVQGAVLEATHAPHEPSALHKGLVPVQGELVAWLQAAQPVAGMQSGVVLVATQGAFVTESQFTQAPVLEHKIFGESRLQGELSAVLQATHWPVALQRGVFVSVRQGLCVPVLQAVQLPVPEHKGVVDVQGARLLVVHAIHWPVASQRGVVPEQGELLEVWHATQAPVAEQRGVVLAAEHPAFVARVQAEQTPVAVLHRGSVLDGQPELTQLKHL
jgi:hypothetical protein